MVEKKGSCKTSLLDLTDELLGRILTAGKCHAEGRAVCKHLLQVSDASRTHLSINPSMIEGTSTSVQLATVLRLSNLVCLDIEAIPPSIVQAVFGMLFGRPLKNLSLRHVIGLGADVLAQFVRSCRKTLERVDILFSTVIGSLDDVYEAVGECNLVKVAVQIYCEELQEEGSDSAANELKAVRGSCGAGSRLESLCLFTGGNLAPSEADIISQLPQLQSLTSERHPLSDDVAAKLGGGCCRNLRYLSVEMTESQVRMLAPGCPMLKTVVGLPRLSIGGLSSLAINCPRLKSPVTIELNGTAIHQADELRRSLSQLKKLEYMNVMVEAFYEESIAIEEAIVLGLPEMVRLQRLSLQGAVGVNLAIAANACCWSLPDFVELDVEVGQLTFERLKLYARPLLHSQGLEPYVPRKGGQTICSRPIGEPDSDSELA